MHYARPLLPGSLLRLTLLHGARHSASTVVSLLQNREQRNPLIGSLNEIKDIIIMLTYIFYI